MIAPDHDRPDVGGPAALTPNLIASSADGGRIVDNIVRFVRLLRAAGLPVGPDRTVLATRAVLAAGIDSPTLLYWTLHAVLVSRPEHHLIFDQAFYLVWKDPQFLQQMLSVMLPEAAGDKTPGTELSRRLAESLFTAQLPERPREDDKIEIDASGTWSAVDALQTKDFEQMTTAELAEARRAIASMQVLLEQIPTRRFEATPRGRRIDMRAVLRASAASGGDIAALRFRRRRYRTPPLVILCDISGSMDTYARIMLHFLYAMTNARDRVSAFLFGTHLTNITRSLKSRDADQAIAKVSGDVTDWSGGTRIGASLAAFNRLWARRVLGQNATVLLFTDGLDREGGEGLATEIRRLRASCRRLVWLNPLLRYSAYEPLAGGASVLADHVSETRSCHNLASLSDLASALGAPRDSAATARRKAPPT